MRITKENEKHREKTNKRKRQTKCNVARALRIKEIESIDEVEGGMQSQTEQSKSKDPQ
jgi:hypothetical protein